MTITIPVWLIQMFLIVLFGLFIFFMAVGVLAFWASFDLGKED